MSLLLHGDCLEHLKSVDSDSVDFIFCDLPYGQTSCKWDIIIPWEPFWNEILRVKKLHTPIFFTTTTKFGVELINNAPKCCPFRYDIVWVKSAPAGFLSAKKMPMRKHEMVYAFYEKLPLYDLSSHTHKFIKEGKKSEEIIEPNEEYDKRDKKVRNTVKKEENYGKGYLDKKVNFRKYDPTLGGKGAPSHLYDPPLPTSVVKEEPKKNIKGENNTYNTEGRKKPIVREEGGKYDPPLPVSVVKEDMMEKSMYGELPKTDKYAESVGISKSDKHKVHYDPPLPNSILEVKSTRGKHSTEKPVALMSWLLKYYSKEGDTVLDPTMGSGSTGVACKNMNRNFIGIEKDPEIYEIAVNRIED